MPGKMKSAFIDGAAFRATVAKALEKKDAAGAVLLLDLDNFHQVNVQAGHAKGDAVLGAVVRILRKWAADGWRVGRIGGDEFALFAPDTALETAFLRADKLRNELNAALSREAPKGLKVTASIGVAGLPRDAKGASELMSKADLALYAAKEQGGDTVALAPGDEMVLKSSYYTAAQLGRLKALAERMKKKESVLLREALDDVLRKYDRA